MLALTYRMNPLGWATCKLLKRLWPGCLLSRVGGLRLENTDPPKLPPGKWVRVRTKLAGVCGTDIAILAKQQRPDSILQAFSSMPCVLGHENVSVVEEVADGVSPDWVGKRVCVDPGLGCQARGIDPPCEPCSRGQFGACERFGGQVPGTSELPAGTSQGYNSRTGGAFAETFVAHESQLVAVPEGISDDMALLTDPIACAMHSVLRMDLSQARRVLVYGTGVLGLGVICSLRAMGYAGQLDALGRRKTAGVRARDFGADEFLNPGRRTAARFERIAARTDATVQKFRFGNCMLSGGYDVVFDCVTSRQSLTESLRWTKARGTMAYVGTGDGHGADLTPIWFRELNVIGTYGRQIEQVDGRAIGTYQLVHELMAAGRLPVESMLTHKFRLEEYKRALGVAMRKRRHDAIKVAFDFR